MICSNNACGCLITMSVSCFNVILAVLLECPYNVILAVLLKCPYNVILAGLLKCPYDAIVCTKTNRVQNSGEIDILAS